VRSIIYLDVLNQIKRFDQCIVRRKTVGTAIFEVAMPNPCCEVVRFRVSVAATDAFVAGRRKADDALRRFTGFVGSELSQSADGTWLLTVRWADRASVQAAQSVTLQAPGLPELAAWLALASEVISFETVEVRERFVIDDPQANLELALRFAREGLGRADMAVFDALVDPEVVVTTGLSPTAPIRGRDAYKAVFASFADAWPVIDFQIDDSFAAGDRVVVSFTATTVFEKDYYGVPASGLVVPLKEQHCYRLRNGRIVENVVGAINLPFEFIMYPALKEAVLGNLRARP
jgi:ketosteroid isomerase-like protein